MEGTSGGECPSPPCQHSPDCGSLIDSAVRTRLMRCVPRLSEYLHLDERFYNHLTSFSVISKHERERIKGRGLSHADQVHRLIDVLLRKPWSHLRAFCRYCYHEDQDYIIREVLGLDEEATFINQQDVSATYHGSSFLLHSPEHPGSSLDDRLGAVCNHLQKSYRQQFRNLQVLDNQVIDMFLHYLPVRLSTSPHASHQSHSLNVDEDKIFDPADSGNPYSDPYDRVLIMGHTGTGKSLTCLHVAVSWSKNLSLKQFKLVLLLDSAVVISYGIKKTILKTMQKQKNLQTVLMEYLEDNADKCLLIIDDLDVILLKKSRETEQEIMDLLSGDTFPGCTLLATAKIDLPQKFSGKFNRHLKHSGFSAEGQCRKFIQEYFKKKPEKSASLEEFLRSQGNDNRLVDEITQRPLWLLVLCRVWELQERTNVDLTMTKLYIRIERNRVKCRKGRPTTKHDLRQLYRLCLFCIVHKRFLLKPKDLAGISKTSIVFDFFLRRSYVTDDFEEEFGYNLPQRSLLLFFAAREISELLTDCQSVWILINILLGDEENADIAPFLAGLLRLPNTLDLVLLHELFRQSLDLSKLKGECVAAMKQAKDMVQLLVEECRACLSNPSTISMDENILSQKKLRRQSFAADITDKSSLAKRIKQMVSDVLFGICSKCLTRLFHHVLRRYHKIVALLRCQYEGMANQESPTSAIFTKLNRDHHKQIFLGTSRKSPHDFLISELRKEDMRLEVKIPYASTLPNLHILVMYLRKILNERVSIQKLKVLVGMGWEDTDRHYSNRSSDKSDITKAVRDCLSKLYRVGLTKVSVHGLDPSLTATLLPTNHPETIDAITVCYMDQTESWKKALSHFPSIRVDHLRFKSLELDMSSMVDTLTDSTGLYENIESVRIGYKAKLSRTAFHKLVSQSQVTLMLEHPTIEGVVYGEVKLVFHPVEAHRDLYLSFAEQPLPTRNLLPSGLSLNKLRICCIYTDQNFRGVLQDLSQDGVAVSDLMLSHTYMSGFILQALTRYKNELHSNVSNITVKHGTYHMDEIREFLLFQCFALCCREELRLDAPSIDGVNLQSITMQTDPHSQNLMVHITYHGESQSYMQLLPPSIQLHSLSLTGLALDQSQVLEALHMDVSKCQVEELVFHFVSHMAGDACVENLLQNMASWQQTVSRVVMRNCCLHTTEMVDLLTLADVTPLLLETVEMGTIKYCRLSIDTDPVTVHIESPYPQDFTDLLPTAHQISKITLCLLSDYNQSVGSNNSAPIDESCREVFQCRSSRKQSPPSSIPRSHRRSHGSHSSGRSRKSSSKSDENASISAGQSSPHSTACSKGSNRSLQNSSSSSRHLPGTCSVPSLNYSDRSISSTSRASTGSNLNQRTPLRDLNVDLDFNADLSNGHSPRTSSPLRTESSPGSSCYCRSYHSTSQHGSSVKTDGSGRTQTDGAHSLMAELEKSVLDEVCFDLTTCTSETCEDILQALCDHGSMLEERITRLIIRHPSLPANILNTFINTPIGLQTKLVQHE